MLTAAQKQQAVFYDSNTWRMRGILLHIADTVKIFHHQHCREMTAINTRAAVGLPQTHWLSLFATRPFLLEQMQRVAWVIRHHQKRW